MILSVGKLLSNGSRAKTICSIFAIFLYILGYFKRTIKSVEIIGYSNSSPQYMLLLSPFL